VDVTLTLEARDLLITSMNRRKDYSTHIRCLYVSHVGFCFSPNDNYKFKGFISSKLLHNLQCCLILFYSLLISGKCKR